MSLPDGHLTPANNPIYIGAKMNKANLIEKIKKASRLIKPGQVLDIQLTKKEAEALTGRHKNPEMSEHSGRSKVQELSVIVNPSARTELLRKAGAIPKKAWVGGNQYGPSSSNSKSRKVLSDEWIGGNQFGKVRKKKNPGNVNLKKYKIEKTMLTNKGPVYLKFVVMEDRPHNYNVYLFSEGGDDMSLGYKGGSGYGSWTESHRQGDVIGGGFYDMNAVKYFIQGWLRTKFYRHSPLPGKEFDKEAKKLKSTILK